MAAFSCPLRIQLKIQGQSVAIVLGMWPGGVQKSGNSRGTSEVPSFCKKCCAIASQGYVGSDDTHGYSFNSSLAKSQKSCLLISLM